ncbi:MAG: hypothetical protein DPW14_14940 [Planctomycetes bacterium]|nr:hypothetical protein [Planctomycetota bacterium]
MPPLPLPRPLPPRLVRARFTFKRLGVEFMNSEPPMPPMPLPLTTEPWPPEMSIVAASSRSRGLLQLKKAPVPPLPVSLLPPRAVTSKRVKRDAPAKLGKGLKFLD